MSRKGRNPVPKGETPRDRFIRLAESRTNVALDKIRLIGNLSGSQYEYTQEDIEQIFAALEEAIKSARERFDLGKKKAEEQFRLRVSIEAEAPESPPEEEVREEEPAYGTAEYTDVPEEGERRPEDQ